MPRRSRGCQACRQKRIGCDGGSPSCRQCLLAHRPCSGPVQGLIIINQTNTVTSRHGQNTSISQQQAASSLIPQPSSSAIVSLALVAQFIYFLTSTNESPSKRPWLYALDDLSVAQRGPALDLAMRAAATAFLGVISKNRAAVIEASHLYGKALSCHSSAISQDSRASVTSKICTSVILSLFEAIRPTNPAAYVVHLTACAEMLGSSDLELEENVVLRQVATHVQYQALFCLTATPQICQSPTPRADLWSNVSRLQNQNSCHIVDRVVTELFNLQNLSSRSCNKNDSIWDTLQIGSRIDSLWAEYEEEACQLGKPIGLPSNEKRHYRDAFTAMTVSYFSAARLLLSTVSLPQGLQYPVASRTSEENGRLILSCSSFLMQKDIGCVYLRMFLPLTIAARYGASLEQRNEARTLIKSWLCGTPFSGLGSTALEQVHFVNPTASSQT